jgi:hypothetical protein
MRNENVNESQNQQSCQNAVELTPYGRKQHRSKITKFVQL